MSLKITGDTLERLLGNGRQEVGYVPLRGVVPYADTEIFTVFDGRLVSAVYKVGGENGEIVASVRLAYDSCGLLESIERLQ